jgi:hypothetical protein
MRRIVIPAVARRPELGNLRVLDTRAYVDMLHLSRLFDALPRDPYVPRGFRHKAILRVTRRPSARAGQQNLERLDEGPRPVLYQPRDVNPVHGGLRREYPALRVFEGTPEEAVLRRVMRLFAEQARVPVGGNVLVQAQRITCSREQDGEPSVEGWHRDGVHTLGVLCVARHNVAGGVNEFRARRTEAAAWACQLPVGAMVLFEDEAVEHRVTSIRPLDAVARGYRDVLLLSHPDCPGPASPSFPAGPW